MQRPPADQVALKLLEISRAEGIKITPPLARSIATASGCDVRQAINELQFCSVGDATAPMTRSEATGLTMDRAFNPFDCVVGLFGCFPKDSVRLAQRLYESDTFLGPLLVQENYLKTCHLDLGGADAVADAISGGDLYEFSSRKGCCMADAKALMECALPAVLAGAKLEGRVDFPAYLGKQSTLNKNRRLITDAAKQVKISGTRFATETLPLLYTIAVRPLFADLKRKKGGESAVPGVAAMMFAIGLSKTEWDTVYELGAIRPGQDSVVPAATKGALTKEFGRIWKLAKYGSAVLVNKKRKVAARSALPPSKKTRVLPKAPVDDGDADAERVSENAIEEEEEDQSAYY